MFFDVLLWYVAAIIFLQLIDRNVFLQHFNVHAGNGQSDHLLLVIRILQFWYQIVDQIRFDLMEIVVVGDFVQFLERRQRRHLEPYTEFISDIRQNGPTIWQKNVCFFNA